jgi:ferredoxin
MPPINLTKYPELIEYINSKLNIDMLTIEDDEYSDYPKNDVIFRLAAHGGFVEFIKYYYENSTEKYDYINKPDIEESFEIFAKNNNKDGLKEMLVILYDFDDIQVNHVINCKNCKDCVELCMNNYYGCDSYVEIIFNTCNKFARLSYNENINEIFELNGIKYKNQETNTF